MQVWLRFKHCCIVYNDCLDSVFGGHQLYQVLARIQHLIDGGCIVSMPPDVEDRQMATVRHFCPQVWANPH